MRAAFAGPPEPAFSFSAFLLPARPFVCVDGAGFPSSRFAVVLDSFTTGSHASNRACLGRRWCRSPTWTPKTHTGPHRAEFGFPPQKTNLPLPLKGEGLGIIFLGLLGLPCSFTTGSHWPNRAGLLLRWCRSPTSPSDRPRIATQGRVWFHRLFLLDFLGGNPASCRSRW